jgi:general stress protein YciG
MDKKVSIVKVDKRSHRVIAQENWGLTDEQMKGMHVHHRVPRSKGGTNDRSNLYVCSQWFHAYVWHNKAFFITWATQVGNDNVSLKRGFLSEDYLKSEKKKETSRKQGERVATERIGFLDPTYLSSEKKKKDSAEAGKKGGRTNAQKRLGICSPEYASSDKKREVCRQNGIEHGPKAAKVTNSQLWQSTVDGFISTAGPVAHHNKANGWDPGARIRVQ